MPQKFDNDDDGVINLRDSSREDEEPEFRINRVEDDGVSKERVRLGDESGKCSVDDEDVEKPFGGISTVPLDELEKADMKPHDKVKVKFDKFVNLVETHDCEEVFEDHMDEDIIISTGLLADLANAHEEKPDRKVPFIFVVGILLGIGLAWILLRS